MKTKQDFEPKDIMDTYQLSAVRIGALHGECIIRAKTSEQFYICTQTMYGPSEVQIPCSDWKEVYDFMQKRHNQKMVDVSNISWDTDGEKVELPFSLSFMVDKDGDLNYNICNHLSNEYGYCVLDYTLGEYYARR